MSGVWTCFLLAPLVAGLDLPDLVGYATDPIAWFKGQELHAPLVHEPKQLLPTTEEIIDMTAEDKTERMHYFCAALVLIFLIVVMLGTGIMILGPKVKKYMAGTCQYELLDTMGSDTEAPRALSRGSAAGVVRDTRTLGVQAQRVMVSLAFSSTVLASAAACGYSLWSGRINKDTGLDWELYVALWVAGGTSLLVQAVFAVRLLPEDEEFSILAFPEAAFVALVPFISDGFDTLKDTVFSALCLQSEHVSLKVIGAASFLYLIVIHIFFIAYDHTMAELVGSYLPALTALPKMDKPENTANDSCCGCLWSRLARIGRFVLPLLYKQVTPTKRVLLVIENVPQALMSVLFLCLEGGSTFVAVINVAIPLAQICATFALFPVLRTCVSTQLGQRLAQVLKKPDYLKSRQLWYEAFNGDSELLRAALPQLLEVPSISRLVKLKDVVDSNKLLEFLPGYIVEIIENEGVVDFDKASSRFGHAPLHLAVEAGDGPLVTILLAADVPLRGRHEGWTPLHVAASQGHVDILASLLAAKAPVDAMSDRAGTALHQAVDKGYVKIVHHLLEAHASLDARGKDGWSPLHIAASRGHPEILKSLLAAKAPIDAMSSDGTALHQAVNRGAADIVQQLLEDKAAVDGKTEDGWTPLHVAAARGHLGDLQLLLAANAPLDVVANDGKTPLEEAEQHRQTAAVKILEDADGKEAVKCGSGIHPAARQGNLAAVRHHLRSDAEAVFATDAAGHRALHEAAAQGHVAVCRRLLAARALVEAHSLEGKTPLRFAAAGGHLAICQLLLEAHALPRYEANDGKTPLERAKGGGHTEIVQLLEAEVTARQLGTSDEFLDANGM